MNQRWIVLLLLALGSGGTLLAEIVEVELVLPLPARLDLRGRDTVVVTPFLTVNLDGDSGPSEYREVNVQKEFDRYLKRIVRRTTRLKVLESGPLDFPTFNLVDLAEDGDFWRYVGETTQADLILAGGIDFDVHRLKGYREEPFSAGSATYFRRVLVEKSGFEFDILMLVIDGRNGKLLFADNFKDFREFERARVDPLVGMSENLDRLEARIMNIFAERTLKTPRAMFSH